METTIIEQKIKKLSGSPFNSEIWTNYQVTWNFIGKLCGSTPSKKELIDDWLNAQKPSVRPPGGKSLDELREEVINRLPDEESLEIAQKSTVVFQELEGFLVQPVFSIRAHLKDCASQIQSQFTGKIRGERSFVTKIKNGLYVKGDLLDEFGTDCVFILKNGKQIKKPEGFIEKAIHVNGPRGPMNALKRFAYILNPTIKFTLTILGASVKLHDLDLLLKYGAVHGFGGERSMGDGRYSFIIECKENKK